MRNIKLICLLVVLAVVSGCSDQSSSSDNSAQATLTPVQQGKALARRCSMCHGPQGISQVPSYPSLAGLSADYIERELLAFKSGQRKNPIMANMVVNLSTQEIQYLAAYYQSLPPAP